MDCRSPAAQFLQAFFAPPLDCYLHYRILPAEKAVPSLLTQANGTTAWTCLFSLYVTIFLSPLDEGLAGVPLLDKHCRGKASFSTPLDRSTKIALPLAPFPCQSMIGGTLL